MKYTYATTNWTEQPAPEWLQYINGINSKYQDANGDGTIDSNDLDVLTQNYDLTHGTPTPLGIGCVICQKNKSPKKEGKCPQGVMPQPIGQRKQIEKQLNSGEAVL